MSDRADTEKLDDDSSIWPLLGWVIFAASAGILLIAVFTGGMLRAVILDVVSFWPGWAVALIVAVATWSLGKKRSVRLRAIAPLLLFSWLTGAVGLHYSGWDQLPSAAGDLTGPAVGASETAELTIDVSGEVTLTAGSDHLYEVRLVRSGGSVGPAEALERQTDSNVVVRLNERRDYGWFGSDGWEVSIARAPLWSLSVAASSIDLDLATVSVSALDLVADGAVRLASPSGEVPVLINGAVVLDVPDTTRVEIIGVASVPNGWQETETGWLFPGDGTASYVITVVPGASLEVTQW